MIEKTLVIAPKGKVCSKELSKDKITDSFPVSVQLNTYYRRLIAEGSLFIYKEPEKAEKKEAKKEKPTKTDTR